MRDSTFEKYKRILLFSAATQIYNPDDISYIGWQCGLATAWSKDEIRNAFRWAKRNDLYVQVNLEHIECDTKPSFREIVDSEITCDRIVFEGE